MSYNYFREEEKIQLDEVDIHILNRLQEDSTTQYRQLANEIDKALGTVSNRIQKLKENKVITNYSVKIDPESIGYDLTTLINIQIDVKYLDQINEELTQIPELFAIYNITGDFDIVAIGRFFNRKHFDITIKKIINIPHIKRTASNVVLRTLEEDFRVYIPPIND